MDGGSTDKTAQVASDHLLRPHFISEADGGQAHAVNKGIARASGRYIAWINSDDFYRPNVFPKILQYLYQNPDAAVVYGDGSIVDEAGRFLEPYPTEDWDYTRLAEKCFICQPSLVFRRDILYVIGSLVELLRHVDRDAVAPEVWCRRDGPTRARLEALGIPVRLAPDMPKVSSLPRLSRNLAVYGRFALDWARAGGFRRALLERVDAGIDLVHCNHEALFWLARWLRRHRRVALTGHLAPPSGHQGAAPRRGPAGPHGSAAAPARQPVARGAGGGYASVLHLLDPGRGER